MSERERIDLVLHELRGPAAAIVGAAQLLASRWSELDPARRASLVGVLDREAARLGRLGRDLVVAARAGSGELELEPGPVDVAALAAAAVQAARAAEPDADIRLDLPAGPGPVLRGDAVRLEQALGNLIGNALKFSPPGTPVGVTVEATAAGGAVVVVRDSGPGIPAVHAETVFLRHGRAPGSGRPGSGIGLYVARAVAEAHGGTLTLLTTAPDGAALSLALPPSSS
jgi:signal transduction histidine kinase